MTAVRAGEWESRRRHSMREAPYPASREFRGRFGGHAAFTLVELLVVIAIVSVMAALLLPALAKAKATAQTTACASHLRQQGITFMLYSDGSGGFFPSPCQESSYGATYGYPSPHYWWCQLGPFTDYPNVRVGVSWTGFKKTFFHCPVWKGTSWYGYAMNRFIPPADKIGVWQTQLITFPILRKVIAPSQKILVADSRGFFELGGGWEFTQPAPSCYKFDYVRHEDGVNVLYCDTRVKREAAGEILLRNVSGTLF